MPSFISCDSNAYKTKEIDLKSKTVIRVKATIKEVFPLSDKDSHIRLVINNVRLLFSQNLERTEHFGSLYVAIRRNVSTADRKVLRGLTKGSSIELKGEYIPLANTYNVEENPGLPVLHYTHSPVGYVLYQDNYYTY